MVNHHRKWTGEDVWFLTENAGRLSVAEMSRILGRTQAGIRKKASTLGLDIFVEGKSWRRKDSALSKVLPAKQGPKETKTLCWKCRRAGTLNPAPPCAWIRAFLPVEGWTATETAIGRRVDACPEFVPRGKVKTGRRGLRRKNAAKPAARKATKNDEVCE